MDPGEGIEPPIFSLQRCCLTTRLTGRRPPWDGVMLRRGGEFARGVSRVRGYSAGPPLAVRRSNATMHERATAQQEAEKRGLESALSSASCDRPQSRVFDAAAACIVRTR